MDDIVMEKNPEQFPQTKRSSHKKKKKINYPLLNYLFDLVICCLISFSLLGINFILFAASGPINIFNNGGLRSEILIILIILFFCIVLLCFISSFLKILMYLLTALISSLFTFSMTHQFANFTIGSSGQTEIFWSVAVGIIIFTILILIPKKFKSLLALIAVFCFGAVLVNQNINGNEFVVYSDNSLLNTKTDDDTNEKMIVIMAANAPSYAYLSSLKESDASAFYKNRLMKIMLGFYVKNGFRLYPNAYVTHNNQFVNAARNLNYTADEKNSFLQTQVLKKGYWQFKQREDFEAYLKDNSVYENLKKDGYKINAYQSHGINLCNQNNNLVVNRCVSKINFPLNIDGVEMTKSDKIQILLIQWLESTGLFENENIMKKIYQGMKPIFNPAKTPLTGFSYKNLYVINSYKSLELLQQDIAADKGRNAYFVYLDLPSDMYVYDDMCRLLPPSQWLPKYHHPWVDKQSLLEKRNAYLKQTMCLFGQLEKMMQFISQIPNNDKITIIIEGLGGMDDLLGSGNTSLSERFRNGQMVTLAVRLPTSKGIVINQSICPMEEILNNSLSGGKKCTEFSRTTLSKSTKKAIRESINAVSYTNTIAQKSLQEFNQWYKEWNKINYKAPKIENIKTSLFPSENPPIENEKILSKSINPKEIKVNPEDKFQTLSTFTEDHLNNE